MKSPINFPTGKYMSSKVLSRKNFPQYFSLLTPLWEKESYGNAQTLRCPGVLQHRSTEQHFYSVQFEDRRFIVRMDLYIKFGQCFQIG